ncbi:MAG: hypothetical protein HDQ97_16140 [Lachnospiraceae bacterium]|nr:hypothetical protein [Lachnospiraceae bacterium]
MKNIEYIAELDKTSGEKHKQELNELENAGICSEKWRELLAEYNVYDLRAIYHLYYVLSKKSCENDDVLNGKKIAVIANLYYLEQVEVCCAKLNEVPLEIDIYVCISDSKLENEIDKFMTRKYRIIIKKNRGRDISALLVASRKIILEYEYVCFVHDKKSAQFEEKQWAESWFYSMWENTLGSGSFVKNVIHTMESKKELGLLCIPEPFHGFFYSFMGGMWGKNFENTKQFCAQLGVDAKMEPDKEPISLGTAFWCKTKALLPLFVHEFNYEDFPEEPLPKDETISHAIERSLAYIAQAQGYYTGTLMTDEYSALRVSTLYEMMKVTTLALRTYAPLKFPSDAEQANKINRSLGTFCKKYKKIYIYGAGVKGKKCAASLKQLNVDFAGFVVSDGHAANELLYGKRVFEISSIANGNDVGIILALSEKNRNEVEKNLEGINIGGIIYY